MYSGLALASSQIANGYLVSLLAEQRAGVAKLTAGLSGCVQLVRSSESLVKHTKKDFDHWMGNLATTFRS